MKRNHSFLGIFLVLTFVSMSYATPSWLKKVVKNSNKISNYKGAEAITLFDKGELEFYKNGKVKKNFKIVYKILKNSGKSYRRYDFTNWSFANLKKFKAWRISKGKEVESLSKKDLVKVVIQRNLNSKIKAIFNRAEFSEIEIGEIVAFEFEVEEKKHWTNSYKSWGFHKRLPVKFVQYSVKLPKEWKMNKAEWNTEEIKFEQKGDKYVWTGRNFPFRKYEPFSPPLSYTAKEISYNVYDPKGGSASKDFADWKTVGTWLQANFHEPTKVTKKISAKAKKLTKGLTTFEEKVRAITEFCQNEIRTKEGNFDKVNWKPKNAEETLIDLSGDSKDITALACALLKAIEIEAFPVLATTDFAVNESLPTPLAFDFCFVGISMKNAGILPHLSDAIFDNFLVVDLTTQTTQLGKIPFNFQGKKIFAGKNGRTLKRIPYAKPETYNQIYNVNAVLEKDGSVSAKVKFVYKGGSFLENKKRLEKESNSDLREMWASLLKNNFAMDESSKFELGIERDSIWVSFKVKNDNFLKESGELNFLRVNIFQEFYPNILVEEKRQNPFWFGSPSKFEYNSEWTLPKDREVLTEPQETRASCGVRSVFYKTEQNGNKLNSTMILTETGELLEAEHYEKVKEYFDELCEVYGQMVLISKSDEVKK